jgi:mono/diheme cytochrome c family protein
MGLDRPGLWSRIDPNPFFLARPSPSSPRSIVTLISGANRMIENVREPAIPALVLWFAAFGFPAVPEAYGQDAQAQKAGSPGSDAPTFARDIAPIFVAMCSNCHDAKQKRGGFDLTTFRSMMAGGDSGPVIVPSKADASRLVALVRSREMPRGGGNNRRLSDEAIERIAAWVDQGARLDAGIEPTAALAKIAPTPEELRRMRLAQLKPDERDRQIETTGRARWARATKVEPKLTVGSHVLALSTLPDDRAKTLVETMDGQVKALRGLLGDDGAKVLSGPEKVSLYVFTEPNPFVEFGRGVENRELNIAVDADRAHGDLGVEAPYIVILDPLEGAASDPTPDPAAAKKKARGRRDEPVETGRNLAGLTAEALASGVAAELADDPPRWLVTGLGAFAAAQIEPRSARTRALRAEVLSLARRGWTPLVRAALSPDAAPDQARAVGFSLVEFLMNTNRAFAGPFFREVARDPRQFDQIIFKGLRTQPDPFFQAWGAWVVRNYARGY